MKHPHHDLIIEWAKDTTRVVQVNPDPYTADDWVDAPVPSWNPNMGYRFKPVPKPDVMREYVCTVYTLRRPEHWEIANLRLVFDGETGTLTKAEVIK